MRHIYLALGLGLFGCTHSEAVQVIDPLRVACSMGLVQEAAVQASAHVRDIPVESLAAALCEVPAVFDAWEGARADRADPATAAVAAAEKEGLL